MRRIITGVAVAVALAATLPAPTHAADGPERVLIVGDSVTQGFRGDYTWRYFAWKSLEQLATPVDFVGSASGPYSNGDWNYPGADAYADPDFDQQHAAIAGGVLQYEGHSLLTWPVAQEIAAHDPDTVVSMWGINDLGDANQSVDAIIGYYTQWFARARAAKPTIDFVVAELPQTWLYDGKVSEFNARLRALAGGLSTPESRIVVASSSTLTQNEFIDGIHPTKAGEQRIAAMMVDAMAPLLASETPSVDTTTSPLPEPSPLAQPSPIPVATAPPYSAPSSTGLQPPAAPRHVRAWRRGPRVVLTWRAVRSAEHYVASCGPAQRTTSRSTVAMRSAVGRCRVRSTNTVGTSPWVRARVRR